MHLSDIRCAAIAGIMDFALLSPAGAQPPARFEVASIRQDINGGFNTNINISGGRFTVRNGSLKTLIRNAYGILSFQLVGEPRWLDTEFYDISAATGSTEKIAPEQLKLLLQDLLADRFRLKVHWETRQTSVYALVLDKAGPKLAQSAPQTEPSINTQKGAGRVRMVGAGEPLSILASNLGNQLSRIVVDKTGLVGTYNWTLEWDSDPTAESTRPSLFTALKEQLGLSLKPEKGPMETLVIDNAERPTEN